jgi:uncharacterized protein YdaU (DUF1376 family)
MHPIEAGVNYYRRYIGDFQADTMSLSMMEQGAYDRLLDHYYATERPIPLNSDRAAIICRAITLEERAAVQMILDYYFNRTAAGWEHLRVKKEIELSKARSGAAKESGKRGADSRWHGKHDGKPYGEQDGNSDSKGDSKADSKRNGSPTTNHQPNTNNTTSSAIADYSAGFVRFWQTWPKSKRKLRKFNAWKIWTRLNLDPFTETIVAHVLAARDSQHWRDGFDPMPETYLNQRRWDDDLEPGAERLVI